MRGDSFVGRHSRLQKFIVGLSKSDLHAAIMRKMLLTAMGVLRNQEPFDPEWSKKVQAKYQEKLQAT